MSDLNLRNIPLDLRSALKAEAKAVGKGLIEYSIEILASRGTQQKPAVAPLLPPASIPEPGAELLNSFHAKNGTQKSPAPLPVQMTGSAAEGMWPAELPQVGSEPLVAEEPPSPAKKAKCPHGWMNSALCPQCRAQG